MRVTYDGGKSTPYYVEITANPDKRRRTAEIETTIYWDDGERPRRATCTRDINRQREADRLFSEVLALLARAESTRRPQSRTRFMSSSRGSAWS